MTKTAKLLTGLGALAVVGLGTVVILSSHWDPITVDNPKVAVSFGFTTLHRMKVSRGGDGKAVSLQRDITSLESVSIVTRDGQSHAVDFRPGTPIQFTIYNSATPLTVKTVTAQPYNQLIAEVNGLFGTCSISSILLNNCAAADDGLRLHAVRFLNNQGGASHYCLNAWEDLTQGTNTCPPPDAIRSVHVQFEMKKE